MVKERDYGLQMPTTKMQKQITVCLLTGAAAAFSVGFIEVSWAVWGELALGLFSAVASGAVFLMAFTSSIWACYAAYVLFKSCYMFLITITM